MGIVEFSKDSKKSLENLYSNFFMNQIIHISWNYVYMEQHEHIQRLWNQYINSTSWIDMRMNGDIYNQKFEKLKNGWNRPMGRHWYKQSI